MKNIQYSIIVPVYNSEQTLKSLFSRIKQTFDNINSSFELIFVEDHSADASWIEICRLKEKHPKEITAIQLAKNFGQHNAILCGLEYAKGQFIITIDDDLQFPPEQIIELIKCQEKNHSELVYGVPEKKMHRFTKNLGSRCFQNLFRYIFKTTGNITAFRLFSSSLANRIKSHKKSFVFIDGLLVWHTSLINYATIKHEQRALGKSSYTLRKQFHLAANLLFNFSTLPLRFIIYLGFFVSFSSFLGGVYFVCRKLLINVPLGYTSLIVTLLFMSGTLLLATGVIGEYLNRLYCLQNNKPDYSIREIYEPKHID